MSAEKDIEVIDLTVNTTKRRRESYDGISASQGEQADGVSGSYTPSSQEIMVICRLYDYDGVVDLVHFEDIIYALGFDADERMKIEAGQPRKEKMMFVTLPNMVDLVENALRRNRKKTKVSDENDEKNVEVDVFDLSEDIKILLTICIRCYQEIPPTKEIYRCEKNKSIICGSC